MKTLQNSMRVKVGYLFNSRRSFQWAVCLTKRAPDAGDSGAIPSMFLRLSIFPVGRRPAARPSAGNANRWALGKLPSNTLKKEI